MRIKGLPLQLVDGKYYEHGIKESMLSEPVCPMLFTSHKQYILLSKGAMSPYIWPVFRCSCRIQIFFYLFASHSVFSSIWKMEQCIARTMWTKWIVEDARRQNAAQWDSDMEECQTGNCYHAQDAKASSVGGIDWKQLTFHTCNAWHGWRWWQRNGRRNRTMNVCKWDTRCMLTCQCCAYAGARFTHTCSYMFFFFLFLFCFSLLYAIRPSGDERIVCANREDALWEGDGTAASMQQRQRTSRCGVWWELWNCFFRSRFFFFFVRL